MFKPLTPIISVLLIASQGLYLGAKAEETLIAFNQPQAAMATTKAVLEQDTHALESQNHVVPGITLYAHNIGGDEAERLAKDGVLVGTDCAANYIDLESGNILVTPENNIVVGTNKGKISVAAGATAFISESSDDLVIYDLVQAKPNQITVSVNKQKLVLEPGQMLVLTNENSNDFEKLNIDCHCVAYRSAVATSLNGNTLKAFKAEFSIASALTTIQPLQRLTVSKHAQDKLALAKLLKAAVVMGEFATNAAGPAQQIAHTDAPQIADAAH